MRRLFRALTLFAFVAASGCLEKPVDETPFEPDPIFQDSSQIITGTLSPMGSKFQGFTITFAAQTRVTFVSLMAGNTPLTVPATLTLGTPAADGLSCTAATTVTVAPALTTHITQELVTGNYCVGLADPGNLTGDATFAVRVRQTIAPLFFGTPGTETLSTNLYPTGVINRTVGVTGNGDLKVELTSASPQAAIGLGIGVTDDNVGDCYLNKIVVSTPGASSVLTASVEKGLHCVKVFDPGGLPDRVTFNVQITHP